jgi:putative ATPase
MLEAGDDPRFIARRLIILASEDIGMADPQALVVAVAAAQAVDHVGLPEAQLNLAQAVVYLAQAPKNNGSAVAIWNARSDIRQGVDVEVPAHLRDAHYAGAEVLGHGTEYRSPHDEQVRKWNRTIFLRRLKGRCGGVIRITSRRITSKSVWMSAHNEVV